RRRCRATTPAGWATTPTGPSPPTCSPSTAGPPSCRGSWSWPGGSETAGAARAGAAPGTGARAGRALGAARVEDGAEGVAQQDPTQHEEDERQAGPERDVPVRQRVAGRAEDPVARERDHLPPVGVADVGAEAEERQRRGG